MKPSILAVCLCLIMSCTDINLDQDFQLDTSQVELAVPLFKSQLSIPAISDASDINGNIDILSDGTIQVNYLGNFIRQNSTEIFAPIPGIIDLPLRDTVQTIQLPANAGDQINKAIIGNTNIEFKWGTTLKDIYEIEVSLPELSLNGETFRQMYILDNRDGNQQLVESGPISLKGYTLIPDKNRLTLKYRATNSEGEPVVLPVATIGFDVFTFEYVEGLFQERTFDIQGDIITIDIFSKWVSGGVEFTDPSVTLIVDNSFGLPTRSMVNFLDVITLDGNTLKLQSSLLNEGIEFSYPTLDEVGIVSRTEVVFNQNNSNIKELFANKAGKVSYDIDALVNDQSMAAVGFLTDSSYFNIQVGVNLPINGKVNDLVLQEVTELDLSSYDDVSSMELQYQFENGYPMDIMIQVYFDDGVAAVDSLFNERWLTIEGASLGPDGLVDNTSDIEGNVMVTNEKMDRIRNATAIKVLGRFDTGDYSQPVKLLDIYKLGVTMGAKIVLQ